MQSYEIIQMILGGLGVVFVIWILFGVPLGIYLVIIDAEKTAVKDIKNKGNVEEEGIKTKNSKKSKNTKIEYSNFGIRLVAYIIDAFVLSFIFLIFAVIVTVLMINLEVSQENINLYTGVYFLIIPLIMWLYFALMESSHYQATIGKLLLEIKVTDLDGKRITFSRATVRTFSKVLSKIILYIGFLMILWTEKRQGLHDMISSTIVVKNK